MDLRSQLKKPKTPGQIISDTVARVVRSWWFLLFHILFIFVWMTLNSNGVFSFDRYPFEILRWMLMLEAGFIGLMLLMRQNRQDEKYHDVLIKDFIIECKIQQEQHNIILPLLENNKKRIEDLENKTKK